MENMCNITLFQLTSLCNVVYKLVTKTIVNRLKILTEVVSLAQGSFVPRHQITNNIVICLDIVRTLQQKD